ncbi:MAG: hypothetical protein DME04_11915 [Candidatus Rokuibacteriota bacterium]|nr:MAG: hypothetical protein DME04_11915 [Candidatus Rokubacteria bacterium]
MNTDPLWVFLVAGVATMRMVAYWSPRQPGVYPVGVEIVFGAEPAERLPDALAAGWVRLDSPQPV